MKKVIKFTVCILMTFILSGALLNYTVNRNALAAAATKLSISGAEASPGGEFEINVSFSNAKGVGAYQLKISYDKQQFEFISGETIAKAAQFDVNSMEDEINAIAVLSDNVSTDNEKMFKLKFKTKETAKQGEYKVSFVSGEVVNGSSYENVSFETQSGVIKVDSSIIKGDIDGNGKVNITDAMRVFHYVSGRNKSFTDKNILAADINGDGKISIVDAMKIFHYVSGRIKTLGQASVNSSNANTNNTTGSTSNTGNTNNTSNTNTSTNTNTSVSVSGVSISKTSLSLNVGGTGTLTATVSPSNATNKKVTWTSSDTSVATVDSAGKVTAKKAGTATITVKTADGSKTATCLVTVKVPVTDVSINKTSLSLNVGGTGTLTATVSPSNATNKKVTWTSSDTSVATVDSTGKITAKKAGTTTILVKTSDGSKIATCAVTVNVPITDIYTLNMSLKLNVGDMRKVSIIVMPDNATNNNLTWSSDNTSVATVDSTGMVVAKGVGRAIITVKTADGYKKEVCVVDVNVPVTGVKITNKELVPLDINNSSNRTFKCAVSVEPSNASDKSVTWTSSDTSVATVDSNGKITAKAIGKATITVTTKDGGKKDNIYVYVYKTNAVIPKGGNTWYKIKLFGEKNLLYMDVFEGKTYNGAKVELYTSNDANNAQYWQFHDYTSTHGGIAIVPKCNSGSFILDVNRGDSYTTPFKENNLIDLWTLGNDDAASMWEMVRLWDNSYIFKLKNTNWVVGVTSKSSGAQLMLRKFDVFDTAQRWELQAVDLSESSTSDNYSTKLNVLKNRSPFRAGDTWFGSFDGASQCHGWALVVGNEISGTSPRNWKKSYTLSGVKTGDIIRYGQGDYNAHTIVVTGVSGDVITYADCNGDGNNTCIVKWGKQVKISSNSLYGYVFNYRLVAP